MRPMQTSTDDASGGTVTSGVLPLDTYADAEVAIQVVITGTATVTVQQTLDNVQDADVTPTWFDHPDSNLVSATTNVQGNYAFAPAAVRMQQTAGSGSAVLRLIQSGRF